MIAASSAVMLWLLWGGLGLLFVALYLAVYFFIWMKWGHGRWRDQPTDDGPSAAPPT